MSQGIFLLEADRHSREGLRDFFVLSGYAVETVAGGSEALDKIKNRRFDVAIIDLDLPTAHGLSPSGWDVVRTLRADHPAAPVVVVSAENPGDLMPRAHELGVAAILEKPISLTHLKALVGRLNPQGTLAVTALEVGAPVPPVRARADRLM
jgi:DNA-binding response OmpR family regulator